jgi:hypothetical protein
VFDRLIATLHPPVRPHAIAKLPPVRSAGAGPPRDQRGTTIGIRRRLLCRYNSTGVCIKTRTGPNRVVLSVVGIVPAEIAGVLVLILILILVS